MVEKTISETEILKDAQLRFDKAQGLIANIKASIGRAIIGQERVVDLAICAILSGGHALLIGMPGLAKTKLVEAMAFACGLEFNRIQFTPDLMPSDILGSEVLETDATGARSFRFIEGPIFTQMLMADEINRASPRTQSALLQAMQENRVAIAGKNRNLPSPFHVLATQNPIEHEGAYPLPEAQLDRFILHIKISYPDEDAERKILIETTGKSNNLAQSHIDIQDLLSLQDFVRDMPISEEFVGLALGLVRGLRPETSEVQNVKEFVEWGPGPRGGQALIMASKAHALIRGRATPTLFDLSQIAPSALEHRMALKWNAQSQNCTCQSLIEEVLLATRN